VTNKLSCFGGRKIHAFRSTGTGRRKGSANGTMQDIRKIMEHHGDMNLVLRGTTWHAAERLYVVLSGRCVWLESMQLVNVFLFMRTHKTTVFWSYTCNHLPISVSLSIKLVNVLMCHR